MSEGYDFLQNSDNGFVTGTVDSAGTVSPESIYENAYGPDDVMGHSDVDHDVSYDSFDNKSLNVDEVKIDRDLGIVDVFENGKLGERYSLLGILDDEDGAQAYFGKDFGQSTEVLQQEGSEVSNWGPSLAAAYEALKRDIGMDTDRVKDRTTVSLKEDEDDSADYKLDNYSEADARSDLKQVDNALERLADPTIDGLEEFENKGEATVKGNDHPFSSSGGSGARGYDAARNFDHKFDRLNTAGIIGYELESLTENGDSSEVTLSIEDQYLDGDSVREDIEAASDTDSIEELVDERFVW